MKHKLIPSILLLTLLWPAHYIYAAENSCLHVRQAGLRPMAAGEGRRDISSKPESELPKRCMPLVKAIAELTQDIGGCHKDGTTTEPILRFGDFEAVAHPPFHFGMAIMHTLNHIALYLQADIIRAMDGDLNFNYNYVRKARREIFLVVEVLDELSTALQSGKIYSKLSEQLRYELKTMPRPKYWTLAGGAVNSSIAGQLEKGDIPRIQQIRNRIILIISMFDKILSEDHRHDIEDNSRVASVIVTQI